MSAYFIVKKGGGKLAAKKGVTKICLACEEDLPVAKFYVSKSPLHKDGKTPWCKECIVKNSLTKSGEIDEQKFKSILRQIDKPYYKDLIEIAINQFKKEHDFVSEDEVKYYGKELIGLYFTKQNSLRQYNSKSYGDSEKEGFVRKPGTQAANLRIENCITQSEQDKHEYDIGSFVVTDEIKSLFGDGYSTIEYKKMYDKYEKLKLNYTLQTNLHQEALATYVRFKVKEESATAKGNVEEAKKWYDAAQTAASNGRLTPKQLSASDLQKGMNSVCELVKAVEQAVDVVKIMPQFKYRPIDSVDFTIMCYVNYERKLNGQPQVEYEDIYSFYDKKKEEYIKQNGDPYGIFINDPTPNNRDTVKTFLRMPDDYDELAGGSDDE